MVQISSLSTSHPYQKMNSISSKLANKDNDDQSVVVINSALASNNDLKPIIEGAENDQKPNNQSDLKKETSFENKISINEKNGVHTSVHMFAESKLYDETLSNESKMREN